MPEPKLVAIQTRYELKSFWRNPASAFFTFAFPLMFLVIFASLNSNDHIDFLGGLKYNQYYIPAIIGYGVISSCYANVAIALSIRRDSGLLKRLRGTPLPVRDFIGGLLVSRTITAALLVAISTVFGIIVYGVTFPGHYLALIVALVVGAATFCAIGIAVSAIVPNGDAAPAIVNFVYFPILFISGVFFPVKSDTTLSHIAGIFPVRPLIQAIFAAFDPRLAHGPTHGWAWSPIGVMAIWLAGASIFAVRHFSLEPRR
ncbi:MAG: ABC transporter permease [Frankia sp.]